jgi:hypothetical protein
MRRLLIVLSVALVMAVMFVAMASAALADPPAGGSTGCAGGLNNANHAVGQSSPSYDATGRPVAKNGAAPGTQNNSGLDTAGTNYPIDDPTRFCDR